jgi:hypothetical protein
MEVDQYLRIRGIKMDTTKVKILSMGVVAESNLPKQEKLELLDFIKEVEDLSILKSVLEPYELLDENYEEDEDEELEETLMGPLKTPRDEDIQETKMGPLKNPHDEDIQETKMGPLKNPHDEDLLEMEVPSILERRGMTGRVYNWLKTQKDRPKMTIPSTSQYVRPGLKTRLSQSLVRIRPTITQAPALP